jgi:hypothetical protein
MKAYRTKLGMLHRVDGPALEFSDGSIYWYINGINITLAVNLWLEEQNITLPMTESEVSFFIMTFVGE